MWWLEVLWSVGVFFLPVVGQETVTVFFTFTCIWSSFLHQSHPNTSPVWGSRCPPSAGRPWSRPLRDAVRGGQIWVRRCVHAVCLCSFQRSILVQQKCLWCVYLLYLVYDEVTLIAQNSRCFSVLFGQHVEPLSQSIHHGQNDGP